MGITKLTRKELYEKVWSEPIIKLAELYGFSDVWLARICKRNNIPRPPRGYWARIQSGQRVQKTSLPKGDNDTIIEITTHDPALKKERALSSQNHSSRKLLKSIIITEKSIGPHPLISRSADILELADQDCSGLIPHQKGCLDIQVSKSSLQRALLILNTLLNSLILMSFEISLCDNFTRVSKDEVSFNISINEEMDRRKRLKAQDHNLEGYYQFGYGLYEKRTYPSGRLVLSIDGLGFETHHKRTWKDTDSKKLEDCFKGIVLSCIRLTELKKQYLRKVLE